MPRFMTKWFSQIHRTAPADQTPPAILAVGCGYLSPISLCATAPSLPAQNTVSRLTVMPRIDILKRAIDDVEL